MTPHTRALPLTLAAASLAVVTAGCSSPTEPAPATTVELTDSSLVAGAHANPLDPVVFPDANQLAGITAAAESAVAECMADQGLTYVPGDAFPRRRSSQDAQYTYSVTDPQVAATYGFHPASWVDEVNARTAVPPARDPGYEEALYGDVDKVTVTDEQGTVIASYDPDSCVGLAKDAVTPDWAAQDRIFSIGADILLDVADQVAEDEAFVEAAEQWSRCMQESGYTYATPMDANGDDRFSTDLPTAEEIPVAVASAQCQHSSGLLRTWSRIRAELTQAELDKHPGIVAEWLRMQRQAADHASGS